MRRFTVTLVAACSLAPANAHAEVAQIFDSGFLVHETVDVPADEWAAWSALTAPAKWWNPDHTWSGKAENLYIDSQATGCFCELMPVPEGAPEGTRRGSAEHMRIAQSVPGKLLRMKGGLGPLQGEAVEGVLTITLKPLAKGTRISWDYIVGGTMRFKPADIAPAVDKMLGGQLARIGKLLGAEDASPAKPEEATAVAPEPVAAEAPVVDRDEAAAIPVVNTDPAPLEAGEQKAEPAPEPTPAAKPRIKSTLKKPVAD